MIENTLNLVSLGNGLLVERRPEPMARLVPAKEQPSQSRREYQALSPESVRILGEQVEGLGASFAPGLTDPRARRALSAYANLQQTEDRDYLTRVFGVDEFV